jgi:hypothetical protein
MHENKLHTTLYGRLITGIIAVIVALSAQLAPKNVLGQAEGVAIET